MISTAKRLEGIGEYYFSQKLREIDELNRQGKQIISLGIGSPDMPPHPDVIKTLQEESARPDVHAYQSYKGSPVLRRSVAAWYNTWYNVVLNADTEVLPLIGSKEGIMHICMTYINEGDDVLFPTRDILPTGVLQVGGGNIVEYTLEEKNHWLPDLKQLEKQIAGTEKEAGCTVAVCELPAYAHRATAVAIIFESTVNFAKANDV